VLLGSSMRTDWPALAACAAVFLLFVAAIGDLRWRGRERQTGFWALALAGTCAVVLAGEPLLLLTALAVAGYGLLGWLLPRREPLRAGHLPAIIALLVLGDLALFELALVKAAKYPEAGDGLLALQGAGVAGSAFLMTLMAIGIGSRGALLVLADRHLRCVLPLAALLLLALPVAVSRELFLPGALAVPILALAGLGAALGLAALLRKAAGLCPPMPTVATLDLRGAGAVASRVLDRGEAWLRDWPAAMTVFAGILLVLLLAARLGGVGAEPS
jgi:hypothetical protein